MVRDKSADRTIAMAISILMVMECDSHYGGKKANEQERKKLLIHKTTADNFLRFLLYDTKFKSILIPYWVESH
jgi:hypothetical protein